MTAYCPDGQVVHTPPAMPREGLLGYVLRVSAANGYESPWTIFSLAGLSQGQMTTATLPIDKLSSIIGRPIEELARLPWQCYRDGGPVPPMNKGRPQLLRHLLLKHPEICPHCIAENGGVDIAWDLRIMLACPKHKVSLVASCPACHHKLTWFRPGLDRCRCGHRLIADEQTTFPQHTIDLLQIIHDTLHGIPTNPTPLSGIPASDLQGMGIEDLLRLLAKISNTLVGREARGKYAPYDPDRLVRVSGFFEHWPRQFHQFLRAIDPTPSQATIGLARRFSGFYEGIVAAKDISKEKMLFFRTAFGNYGACQGITPGADPRYFLTPGKWRALRKQGLSPSQIRYQAQGAVAPANVVNQTELARRLGVRPITARRWVGSGLFGLKAQGSPDNGRTYYHTPAELPARAVDGALPVREAAKYLRMPVSILLRLRRDGYYRGRHISRRLDLFNTADLTALQAEFLTRAPELLPTRPEGFLTLTEFFRMKLHGVENKYQVIRRILDGNLIPAGRLGDNIGDVMIASESIRAFREDVNIQNAIPAWRAAKILECDPCICAALIAMGKLEGTNRGRNLYVTTQSMAAFQAQYVSCASIAKRLGSSARRIVRLLSERPINLLTAERRYRPNGAQQAFCPREEAEQLFGLSS